MTALKSIVSADVYATRGMPQPILCLHDRDGERIPIATRSWHMDYAGYITWPPTADQRDDWLADVVGGVCPQANDLRDTVSAWLAAADLGPLDDNDNRDGHGALAASLMEAVKHAQAATL